MSNTLWQNRIVRYEDVDPAQLVANPANWRIHSAQQQLAMSGSLDELGWLVPVIIQDGTGFVVDGHMRVALAIARGEPTVPGAFVDLDDDEVKTAIATLDPIGAMAGADTERLDALLADISTESAGMRAMLDDLAKTHGIGSGSNLGLTDPDTVSAPRADPVTKPGDLWLLGEHRLLCGDATVEADVRRLMDGERAVLMATDPPYLVDYDGGSHPQSFQERTEKPWQGKYFTGDGEKGKYWDSYHDGDERLFVDFLALAIAEALVPDCPVYQWHAARRQHFVHEAWAANKMLWHQSIIWVKSRPVLTRSHFMWAFEPCAYGWVQGNAPAKDRRPPASVQNVWHIDSTKNDVDTSDDRVEHPTQKPVETIARPIEYHTRPGELLYEPFCGSGTAIIAAEMSGRRCFAMELEPIYCDVAIQRWENFTGQTASRERIEDAA